LVTDKLVRKVNEKVCENRRFTISEFSDEFSQISRTVLHELMTEIRLQEVLCSMDAQGWLKTGDFYVDEIFKLVKRYDKCLNVYENYVEK